MKLFLYLYLGWLPVVVLGAIVSLPYEAQAQSVMVAWDRVQDTNVLGYRVLAGSASRSYTITNWVGGEVATCTLSNLPSGPVFLAVVAFDNMNLQSDFSNEVIWTNRLAAPRRFRMVATVQASASPSGPWQQVAQVAVPLAPVPDYPFYSASVFLEELKGSK